MEVPGQADLEFLLAPYGLRATPAERQHIDHRIFVRPFLRGNQNRGDRLGIREPVFRQTLLWWPAKLHEQSGVPGHPLQRRGGHPRSGAKLKLRSRMSLAQTHNPATRRFSMKWITRERVKVDRVACPWLIKKFVDKDAEFVFVP